MTAVFSQQGDTVDLICQRHLGRTAGVTEATYQLNPHLARHTVQLPPGTAITLPVNQATHPATTLNLWD